MSSPAERVESAPTYLTAEQVAAMLQVNVKTITRWSLSDSSMPVTRLGRVVRFEQGALRRWLALKGSPKNHRSGR